ncbi:MAG TPA: protein kinase, partial [Planctomycetaceae bacterium]
CMASDPNGIPEELADERAWAETRSLGGITSDLLAAAGRAKAVKLPGELTGGLTGELGRYKIIRRLGEGGMGTVFLAHDSQFDHKVALKVPHFTGTNDQTVVERFYREARAAIKLRHSNLCPVYDVGEINGQHFLSMAYIEGRPLAEIIDPDHPLPEPKVARIVCKIALALEEAHENGVVHRDLKPGNIMLDEKRNEPIVMDFGLAMQLDLSFNPRLTQTGTIVGSPAYMSPEQARNEGPLGPATDIYSLGVILYELLVGRSPFDGSAAKVLGMVAVKDPDPPSRLRPSVDPRLEAICLKAMAKNIDDRYKSMREFAIALAAFANPSSATGRGFNPSATLAELVSTAIIPESLEPTVILSTASSIRELPDQERAASRPRRWGVWVAGAVATTLILVAIAIVFFRPRSIGSHDSPSGALAANDAVAGGQRPGIPHGPPHPPPFGSEGFDDFERFDRNRDGALTPDEYPLHIILRADANRDQKLTRQEFDAGQKHLGPELFGPPTGEEGRELRRHGPPSAPSTGY